MKGQTSKQPLLPGYVLPLLTVSLLLSIVSVALHVVDFAKSQGFEMRAALESTSISHVNEFKFGNITYSIPAGAVSQQADAGGRSFVGIYRDEAVVNKVDGLIYSIGIYSANDFETNAAFTFEEWLAREEVSLTGHTQEIDGLEFVEGYGGDINSLGLFHYFEDSENDAVYVIVLPAVKGSDSVGRFIESSLKFE